MFVFPLALVISLHCLEIYRKRSFAKAPGKLSWLSLRLVIWTQVTNSGSWDRDQHWASYSAQSRLEILSPLSLYPPHSPHSASQTNTENLSIKKISYSRESLCKKDIHTLLCSCEAGNKPPMWKTSFLFQEGKKYPHHKRWEIKSQESCVNNLVPFY